MLPDLQQMQRHLAGLLRALWSNDAPIHAIRTGDGTQNASVVRPFISELGVHLPDVVASQGAGQARARYRAALAHAAAHLTYSRGRIARASLKPIQIILLGLLEDARVEWLAIAELPGLRQLWLPWHDVTPEHGIEPRILLQRLSRALLDPGYEDADAWITKARHAFYPDGLHAPPCNDPQRLRELASVLGNDLGQMRLRFDPKTYVIEPGYRDDNGFLWLLDDDAAPNAAFSEQPAAGRSDPSDHHDDERVEQASQNIDDDGLIEREFIAASPGATQTRAALAMRPLSVDEAIGADHHYPEWDYVIETLRPAWARVIDHPKSHAETIDPPRSAPSARRSARTLATQRVRQRRTIDGEDLDVDAWLRARIDRLAIGSADWRVWQRRANRHPRIDLLWLIDRSASTNDRLGDDPLSVLDHLREAAWLGATAAQAAGDDCAIAAFCSDTRNAVHYQRIKDFDGSLDEACQRRLAALQGQLSTRLGAAIRHACRAFDTRRPAPRAIVLLTDGQPHDVDVFDPRYLIEDARCAVAEARRRRINVFCVTIDPNAERYVQQIFGRDGFVQVPRPQALSTWLPAALARLTR